jgi:hypothetical protein
MSCLVHSFLEPFQVKDLCDPSMGCSFFSGTVENKVALQLVMLSEEKGTKAFQILGTMAPKFSFSVSLFSMPH